MRRDGEEIEIPVREVAIGDLVIVREGERVPIDGPVVAGRSALDQSALTGESMPVDKGVGDLVFTGSVNGFGRIEVEAERIGHESTLGQVLRLVAEAQNRKSPMERTADRYARYFLPVVEVTAGLTILAGYLLRWPDTWSRAVAILVVACPCALILATPAAILASMAWLARHGILIKGGGALERLAACDTFAFDKTGTLTRGRPEVAGIRSLEGQPEDKLLALAAIAGGASNHPLAALVAREARSRSLDLPVAFDVLTTPGSGISASFRGDSADVRRVLVGNRRLLADANVDLEVAEIALAELDAKGETPLIVAVDGRIIGLIAARDAVRPEAEDVIQGLKHLAITEVALLTGDREAAAFSVANRVQIKLVEAELLPAGKAGWIEARQAEGRRVAMVGDGINDAPALARADVGIALATIGSDLAAEAGDIVVLGDPLVHLPDLLKLSRATVAVIRQNILIFAFGLNAVAMASAAFGILGPIPAAILHQAGSFLVLLNSMRLLWFGDWRSTAPARLASRIGRSIASLDDRFDPGHAFDRLLKAWRWIAVTLAVAALIGFATSGWAAIEPGEVGLVQRFGRFVGVIEPGLHLRWPAPIERITRVRPGQARSVEVGFRSELPGSAPASVGWGNTHERGIAARAGDEALLMTGDGQLVEVAASAEFRLDPSDEGLRKAVFGGPDMDAALRPLAESSIRAEVARRSLESLLTKGRGDAEEAAAGRLRGLVAASGLGVRITRLAFQDVHPPLAVVDSYRDVSRAESDKLRRAIEGETFRLGRLISAEGFAGSAIERAEAAREGRTTLATGAADAFVDRVEVRKAFPSMNDHRLYSEMVARSFTGREKLVIEPTNGQRQHLYLPPLDGARAWSMSPTSIEPTTEVGPPALFHNRP